MYLLNKKVTLFKESMINVIASEARQSQTPVIASEAWQSHKKRSIIIFHTRLPHCVRNDNIHTRLPQFVRNGTSRGCPAPCGHMQIELFFLFETFK